VEELAVAKKKAPVSPEQDPTEFVEALKALEGRRHFQFVGGIDEDGSVKIDLKQLEELKKKLEALGISQGNIKFVAMNAPFMRRSPTA
jgi:hypothetical protein